MLWNLSHKLSLKEKRAVVREMAASPLETDIKKLFDIMMVQKTYDEDNLIYRFQRVSNKPSGNFNKYFLTVKSQYKKTLLHALVSHHRYFIGGEAEALLYQAEILIQKKLFLSANRELENALYVSQNATSPYFKPMILQRMIWIQPLLAKSNIQSITQKLLEELMIAMKEIELYKDLLLISQQLSSIIRRTTILKLKKDKALVHQIMRSNVFKINAESLPYALKLYYYKNSSWLCGLQNDLLSQAKYQEKLCELLREQEEENLKNIHTQVYLQEFNDLATFFIAQKRWNEAEPIIAYVETLTEGLYKNYFLAYCSMQRMMIIYYSEKDELHLQAAAQKLDALIENQFNTFPVHAKNTFRMNLMKSWLKLRNYEKVKFWFGKHEGKKPSIRYDTYFIIYLIWVCTLYEQFTVSENKTYIEHKNNFNTWAQNLAKMKQSTKENLPLENVVCESFLALSHDSTTIRHIAIFEKLLQRFEKGFPENSGYVKRFYQLWNLPDWVYDQLQELKKIKPEK